MARYFQSQLVTPKSAYVAPPWELMQKKLQDMQSLQDQYKQQVELMGKPMENLSNDTQLILDAKGQVDKKLEGLRKLDYNDPESKDQIYNTIKEVRDIYDPNSVAGLAKSKVTQYEAINKTLEDYKKTNEVVGSYAQAQLIDESQNQNKGLKQDANGQWINTQVNAPELFDYKDLQKTAVEFGAIVETDKSIGGIGAIGGSTDPALQIYRNLQFDDRKQTKIDNTLLSLAASDVNLVKSAKAQRFNTTYNQLLANGYGTVEARKLALDDSEKEAQFVNVDKDGNVVYNKDGTVSWNMETNIGQAMNGVSTGRTKHDVTAGYNFEKDTAKTAAINYDIEHPFVKLSKEIPATNYATTTDSTTKINAKTQSNLLNMNSSWTTMMSKHKELWGQFGIKNVEDIKVLSAELSKNGGMEKWMNTNGNLFVVKDSKGNVVQDDGASVKTYTQDQKLITLLDDEAGTWAAKVNPLSNGVLTLNNGKTMSTVAASEFLALYGYADKSNKNNSFKPNEKQSEEDQLKLNLIARKNGYKSAEDMATALDGAKTDAGPADYSNLIDNGVKYNKAKNDYLKTNATNRAVETWADNTMNVLEPELDVNGKPTGGYVVNQQKTKLLATQVGSMFKSSDGDDVITNVETAPGSGNYKTVGQIKQEKANELTGNKQGDIKSVAVGTPYYSRLPDSNNKPVLVINIGGEEVPISSNKIQVTDEKGNMKSLGEMNNTDVTAVNNFMVPLYSSGVQDYPMEINDGGSLTNVVIHNDRASKSSMDGTTTVTVTDQKTGVSKVYTGAKATGYLVYLSSIGQLKQ